MIKLLGHGLVLWAVTFAVGSALYPLSVDSRPLFESVMALTLVVVSSATILIHLRGAREHVFREALVAACIWPVLCVALDLVVLMLVPPRFGISEYLGEFGLKYLLIPAIVIGLGLPRAGLEARHR
jgi:hypothetical protein